MKKVAIKDIASYLPERLVRNDTIESKVRFSNKPVELSLLKTFGIRERRFAAENEQVSDLACKAAQPILDRNSCEVNLMIFAAASSDLIEPATSNIIQSKLGLSCPVLDIKNACNSFATAIETASAYIQSGMYENVLIVNGEKLSEVVKYDVQDDFTKYMSGYTLGDAGCSVLLSSDEESRTIEFQKFATWGDHWKLCTILGGGSQAYRDWDKYHFKSDSTKLRDVCLANGVGFIEKCFLESGFSKEQIDVVVPHQVSKSMPVLLSEQLSLENAKWVNTFELYGNTAAASIPIALNHAIETKEIDEGNIVLLLGFAAGISISFQIIKF